jgi:hypothetical protein
VATLAAMLDRLVPSDGHGPGALEAGAAEYAAQALADDPECERGLARLDELATAAHGAPFAALASAERDALLGGLEGEPFFELVRRRAIEGFFGGPAGWALLGYPGPRAVWTEEDQALDSS